MKANYLKKMAKQAFNELVEAGKSETLIEYLKTMGRFHNYSLGNVILINFQKHEATHVAGFRTWQKLGRHVKKGEHGIAIMAPMVWRKKSVETDKLEEEMAVAFKTVYVFDVSQTDGDPLPDFARVRGDPEDWLDKLKEFVSSQGIVLEYSNKIGSAEGLSCGGRIKIRTGLSDAEQLSVLAHELAHEILHRDKTNMAKDKKARETEAEAVAFVVCQAVGLDCSTAASDYIQLYKGDKKMLFESLDRIQRTASEILKAVMVDKEQQNVAVEEQSCVAQAA